MDNTICDFATPFYEQGGEETYPHQNEGFFLALEPFAGVVESVTEIENFYDVWFLTKPSYHNIHCYTEKAQWIRKYFGYEFLKRLIMCCDKSLIKGFKGDFLVDDYNKDGQPEFGGHWIHYRNDKYPWKDWRDWLKPENDNRFNIV